MDQGLRVLPMLSNGSNPEGVMPEPKLEWKKQDAVVVHGPFLSPPVTKIRLYLLYGGIAYTQKQHLPTGIRSGPYKKVPSVDIDGRQLNDSYIILKHLAPLIGLELDETWEKKLVLELDCALKLQPSDADWAKMARAHLGMPGCMTSVFARKQYGPLERSQAAKNIESSGLGHAEVDAVAFAKEFKAAMGSNPFVGGESAGTPDLSFYGILADFLHAKCDIADRIVQGGELEEWLSRMEELVPLNSLFGSLTYDGTSVSKR